MGDHFWNPEANKLMAESHQRAKTRSYVWSDAQEASKFGTWSVLTDTQAFIGELIDRVAIDQYHTLARIGRLSRGLAGEFARKFVNEPVQK